MTVAGRLTVCLLILGLPGCDALDPDIRNAKQAVRELQKDPDSAQFRDVRKCPNSSFVTGLVNGKNSYGAYAGFRPFYAIGSFAHIIEDDDSMEDYYHSQCFGQSPKKGVAADTSGIDTSEEDVMEAANRALANAEEAVQNANEALNE